MQDIPSEAVDLKLDGNEEEEGGWGQDDIDLDIGNFSGNYSHNANRGGDQENKPPSFSDLDSPRRPTSAREKHKVDSNASFSHDNIQ